MRLSCVLFLAGIIQAQVVQTTLVSNQQLPTTQVSGDTELWSGWTNASSGGNFNGGRLFGGCNDCTVPAAGGKNRNIWVLELTAYDPNNVSNTNVAQVNSMDDYGTAASKCFDKVNAPSCKSSTPWSLNNILCVNVFNQDTGVPFNAHRSAMVCSPDFGLHWCNLLSYITGLPNGVGSGGVPFTCTSANWSATGDMPTSNAGIQWHDNGDFSTNPMAKMVLLQNCQDNSIGCPAIPGLDTSRYVYFVSLINTPVQTFAIRFDKTCSGGTMPQMLTACWTIYEGAGVWDNNFTGGFDIGVGSFNGLMWSPDLAVILSFTSDANSVMSYGRSTALLSGWGGSSAYTTIRGTPPGQFATPLLPTYSYNSTTKILNLTVAGNDGIGIDHGWLNVLNLQLTGQVFIQGSATVSGNVTIH